jgi:hypothetical protein
MMKWLGLVLVLVGCSNSALKADVEMYCNAPVGPTTNRLEIAVYAAERAQSDELRQLLRQIPGARITAPEFDDQFQKLMKKVGVEHCKSLESLGRRPALPE